MFKQHWATIMLMASVQCWAHNRCCRLPPLICQFPDQLRAVSIYVTMWFLWSCRLRWSVFASIVWCEQTYLRDNIRLGHRACFVFFSALAFFLHFLVLFKISRLYSFKKNNFSKLTKLKIPIQRNSFGGMGHPWSGQLAPAQSWLRTQQTKWNEWVFKPLLFAYRLNWTRRTAWRWYCPPDAEFEIWALAVWGRAH